MFNLALYGCGNRTKALLESLIQDKFYKVHAAYDLNQDSASALTTQFGGNVCKTAEELISFPGVDAFLISLHPCAHAEALRQVIPAGKPVFVEKPVALTGREADELAELADKYHVPVQVGFMRRYLPETIEIFDYIRRNESGRLFAVDCDWFHHIEVATLYYKRFLPDNFRLQVSQIPFHCVHMLDVLLMAGGPVKRVTSQVVKVVDLSYPSPDDLVAQMEFTGGGNGRFHYSSMVYYGAMSYRFHFENYSIKMNTNQNQLEINPRPRFITSRIGVHPERKENFFENYESYCKPQIRNFPQEAHAPHNHTENIMYDFVRMVRDNVYPEANLHVAARVQGLAEAMELSGKLHRTIELDDKGLPII